METGQCNLLLGCNIVFLCNVGCTISGVFG